MNIITLLTNPFVLMSICITLGILLGNIKIGKFCFGTSGSLFIGILVGWRVVAFLNTVEQSSGFYNTAQKMLSQNIIDKGFFDLFLILFIASVGLLAAKEVGKVIKKYGPKFIILGFLITFVGAAATYGVSAIFQLGNPYLYSGAYTGALTSSPGLAASLEASGEHSKEWLGKYSSLTMPEKQKILNILDDSKKLRADEIISLTEEQKNSFIKNVEAGVGAGYAVAYPFGVIIVILAMNIFPLIFRIDTDKEKLLLAEELKDSVNKEDDKKNRKEMKEVHFDLSAFALVCLIGYFIGAINIPLGTIGEVSLGSTGGVLISALALGHIGNIGPFCFRMNDGILGAIRTLTLAHYLSIIGIRYGYQVIDAITGPGLTLVIASIFIGTFAELLGFLVGRYIFKINWVMLSGAITGGMTSTPGLGAAIDVVGSNEPAAGYGAVYPFALFGMVVFSIILNRII